MTKARVKKRSKEEMDLLEFFKEHIVVKKDLP